MSIPALGYTKPLIQYALEVFPPELMRLRREVTHLYLVTKLIMRGAIPS